MQLTLSDLDFEYPESLVATERAQHSRVMLVEKGQPREITAIEELLSLFEAGDTLVLNDTKVLRRRVFSDSGLEILFLSTDDDGETWDVLCPSTRWKNGTLQTLPDGVQLELVSRGRPQKVKASRKLDDRYFEMAGDLPLPPYIQKARNERRNREGDRTEYQTAWALNPGSLAAPTASLHFNEEHLDSLKKRGVNVVKLTLHVGLGTFLPITTENLDEHVMHAEWIEIPKATWQKVNETKAAKKRVWSLGTTVTRTLESASLEMLQTKPDGSLQGESRLFIRPGFEYQVVDVLLTNFHQPKSTLLALVGAFAGLDTVKQAYAWAIAREFRLFSYGDLSVWIR
ncbi:MAG: tRNA preQ1(34) S-adenosylmethionine ribosyltransferase-isomerase QueA [Bdellovibrionota bacterium]